MNNIDSGAITAAPTFRSSNSAVHDAQSVLNEIRMRARRAQEDSTRLQREIKGVEAHVVKLQGEVAIIERKEVELEKDLERQDDILKQLPSRLKNAQEHVDSLTARWNGVVKQAQDFHNLEQRIVEEQKRRLAEPEASMAEVRKELARYNKWHGLEILRRQKVLEEATKRKISNELCLTELRSRLGTMRDDITKLIEQNEALETSETEAGVQLRDATLKAQARTKVEATHPSIDGLLERIRLLHVQRQVDTSLLNENIQRESNRIKHLDDNLADVTTTTTERKLKLDGDHQHFITHKTARHAAHKILLDSKSDILIEIQALTCKTQAIRASVDVRVDGLRSQLETRLREELSFLTLQEASLAETLTEIKKRTATSKIDWAQKIAAKRHELEEVRLKTVAAAVTAHQAEEALKQNPVAEPAEQSSSLIKPAKASRIKKGSEDTKVDRDRISKGKRTSKSARITTKPQTTEPESNPMTDLLFEDDARSHSQCDETKKQTLPQAAAVQETLMCADHKRERRLTSSNKSEMLAKATDSVMQTPVDTHASLAIKKYGTVLKEASRDAMMPSQKNRQVREIFGRTPDWISKEKAKAGIEAVPKPVTKAFSLADVMQEEPRRKVPVTRVITKDVTGTKPKTAKSSGPRVASRQEYRPQRPALNAKTGKKLKPAASTKEEDNSTGSSYDIFN